MARCHIALGGNLGLVADAIRGALLRLGQHPGISVVRTSSVYRTQPVGDAAQHPFLNAAAELDADLPPLPLLDVLQQVETEFGRTRDRRWGDRSLDLDLLFVEDEVIDDARLVVPHRACWYRRFVLDPLCEIAPAKVHPVKQATIRGLRARLLVRPLGVMVAGGTASDRTRFARAVGDGDRAAWMGEWSREAALADEPVFIAWLGPGNTGFEELPPLPRLDLSCGGDPVESLRHVLDAALDEPTCVDGDDLPR